MTKQESVHTISQIREDMKAPLYQQLMFQNIDKARRSKESVVYDTLYSRRREVRPGDDVRTAFAIFYGACKDGKNVG